ncbi:MAG: GNAT family N-acetyltransferase [Deltaproteobacteria bacterium]|nr:GNAT family N-acetyltransferase [Deltaproteobacteria bacterium]
METAIRQARPDDAHFLSWVIHTAGRGHVQRGIWDVILGRPERECLDFFKLLAVSTIPHLYHYSCFLVAEANGKPTAALAGCDPEVCGYPALAQALTQVFGELGWPAPDAAWHERSQRVLCCLPDTVDGAWTVESVATAPEFRRRGLVDKLLVTILDQGRDRGFKRSQINIYIGNTPAQKAYEKHGFRIIDEKRHPSFEEETGSPGMARLLRDL